MLPHNSNLAAVSFTWQQTTFIRVFYQDANSVIRESSFDDKNGWYVTPHTVVTADAEQNSPLAVITSEDGKQLRLYFIDRQRRINECIWNPSSPDRIQGVWSPGTSPIPHGNLAPNSKLAATCTTYKSTKVYRVFFQTDKGRLGQVYCQKPDDWSDDIAPYGTETPIYSGTNLAAISEGKGFRLYFQLDDGCLWRASNTGDSWEYGRMLRRELKTASGSAFSAIAWPDQDSDINVHLFTIDGSKLLRAKREASDLKFDPKIQQLDARPLDKSHLAAVRTHDGKIRAFFNAAPNTILELDADKNVVISNGIPLSVGQFLQSSTGKESNTSNLGNTGSGTDSSSEIEQLKKENAELKDKLKKGGGSDQGMASASNDPPQPAATPATPDTSQLHRSRIVIPVFPPPTPVNAPLYDTTRVMPHVSADGGRGNVIRARKLLQVIHTEMPKRLKMYADAYTDVFDAYALVGETENEISQVNQVLNLYWRTMSMADEKGNFPSWDREDALWKEIDRLREGLGPGWKNDPVNRFPKGRSSEYTV